MKEERFEKVIEWKNNSELAYIIAIVFFNLFVSAVGYFEKEPRNMFMAIVFYNGIVLALYLAFLITSRRVYWRKIK